MILLKTMKVANQQSQERETLSATEVKNAILAATQGGDDSRRLL
jgi:hypothetical protein